MRRILRMLPLLVFILLVFTGLSFASEETGDGRKIWDVVWRVLNFGILVAILWKLLADKVRVFFGERRQEIGVSLDEAQEAVDRAKKKHDEYELKIKNVEEDITEIKDSLISQMELEKKRIMKEGRVSAERIIRQAQESAEQEIVNARKELNDQVADLAADLAGTLVSKNITSEDHKRILDEYLNEVVSKN